MKHSSSSRTPSPHFRTRGFTLIEMLVVIAIIGLLAAITMGSVVKARTRALRVQSVSNLRQIYLGFTTYSLENQGAIPNSWMAANSQLNRPATSWRQQLIDGGHLGAPDRPQSGIHGYSVLGSPVQRQEAAAFTVNAKPPRMSTFGMNGMLNVVNASMTRNRFGIDHFHSPSRTMLVASGRSDDQQWWNVSLEPSKIPNYTGGLIDVLFADGHAESIPEEDYPDQSVPRPVGSAAWYFWIGYQQ